MHLPKINHRGASLIEILAVLAISSLILITVSTILNQNVRYNAIYQEKMINSQVSYSVIKYLNTLDYEDLKSYLENPNIPYKILTYKDCPRLANYHPNYQAICDNSLNPTILDLQYGERIKILLLPYHQTNVINNLLATNDPSITAHPKLVAYLKKINEETEDGSVGLEHENTLRVIVVITSKINANFDYILEGVSINETEIIK